MNELEKAMLAHALTNNDGSVRSPKCCGQDMKLSGGCSEGCCDDFTCGICNKTIRVEWPD